MGHTKPPFTWQFKIEQAYFSRFRRALLLAGDKKHFTDMWNRAEFHVPAAEEAGHPLPIATILMMINLEQEKTIHHLEEKFLIAAQRITALEEKLKVKDAEVLFLKGELDDLEKILETRLKEFRKEILEIKYEYAP